ncbi:sensor histidine kinase [Nodosilinea sp. E11]|uniref:HAMP domain-containing sensor histidine kinase n=1 Tax=Nodosilinea sp. E11 TaxID=3037479 RepID=UPI002934A6F2|nr:sensor histidine kinase [Nodosilinea sp. E11]WOD40364.1 sensor histidine kinase [Nodosilinea sp. E11]
MTKATRLIQRLPLVAVLEVPYLLQMLTVVGLTGWVMMEYRRVTVAELAANLREETTERVLAYVDHQLLVATRLNRTHVAAVETGLIDLENFEQMGRFFWQQMQLYPIDYLNYGNQAGEFIGVERSADGTLVINETRRDNLEQMTIYQTDARGNRTQAESIAAPESNQEEAWYADAALAKQPVWSQIYAWEDQPDVLSISASHPLYTPQGELIGVMGADLVLTQINRFLQAIQVSPSTEIFIVERSGMLVASSDGVAPFEVVDGHSQRRPAIRSFNPRVQATAEQLIRRDQLTTAGPTTFAFWLGRTRQFVSLTPWQDDLGLDWLVVVVVPESDFQAQVDAYIRTALLLALLLLSVTLLLALLAVRWINRPIGQMAIASRAIAKGDRTQTVEMQGIREVRMLAGAFNQMVAQMDAAFTEMERRVVERTTELATAKVAAEAANESKILFLANMSHQLRTPLNIILGFIQVMQHDATIPARHQEALASMRRSADYLLAQINNLLLASKLDTDEGATVTPAWLDLGLLLENLQEQFSAHQIHPVVEFRVTLEGQPPRQICTDEAKLYQILANLLENAFKFTVSGQVTLQIINPIEVGAGDPTASLGQLPSAVSQYHLTFVVTDTGSGIDHADLERLFNPFEQSAPGQRSQRGSGLGLFICQEYVRLLGGDLRCQSQPGQGSRFEFTIAAQGSVQTLTAIDATAEVPPTPASLCPPPLSDDFVAMPRVWRDQLELAATIGDDGTVLALTRTIPAERAALGDWLRYWATDFQFDQILDLIQAVSQESFDCSGREN